MPYRHWSIARKIRRTPALLAGAREVGATLQFLTEARYSPMQGSDAVKPGEAILPGPTDPEGNFACDDPNPRHIVAIEAPSQKKVFWDLHAEAVGRYCMAALGDAELAARVIEEVWTATEKELGEASPTRSFRSLVFGLARRRCAQLLETKKKPSDLSAQVKVRGAPSTDAARLAEQARQLLAKLRPSEREILILRYVAQLSYDEIAGIWGVEASDARFKVSQALVQASAVAKRKELNHD